MNLQMPIRLIATDMDGTLLTDEPLILPETADVLRRAAEKGIVLSIASRRGWTKQTCSTRCSACTRWLRRTTCRFPARRWSSAHS